MIKKYLFILILLSNFCVKVSAQSSPKLMGIVELPSVGEIGDCIFDVKNNNLIVVSIDQVHFYRLSNEGSVISVDDIGRLPINFKEIIYDISLINDTSFYLLTSKFLYSFHINFKTKSVSNSPKILFKQKKPDYIDIYPIKNKEDLLLGVNFTGFPEKEPKINIKSLNSPKGYKHFVKCDPYNIYAKTKLVASNGLGNFILQPDYLTNDLLILDSNLRVINTFKCFDSTIFDPKLGDELCKQAQKYRAFGTLKEHDILAAKTDQFPCIDRLIFVDDTTLLIMGTFPEKVGLGVLFSKFYFNATFTQLLKTETLSFSFGQKNLNKNYQLENTPINPFGKLTRCDGGKIYYIDWVVDTTNVVSNGDYLKAALAGNHTKAGIYIFK